MAPPAPSAPQTPSALLRSAPSSNMFITIESAAGSTTRRSEALDPSHDDQERVTRGQRAGEGRSREDRQSGHEQAPAAEEVGGTAAEKQESPEREPIGRHHPLQI